jgi:hypothetical protein
MNASMADADKPDLRVGTAKQQPLRGREGFICYLKLAGFHVNSDHFA